MTRLSSEWTFGHNYFFKFIYFWERQRQHESGRSGETEEEKESYAVSTPPAQSPMQGSNPQNCEIMTWAKTKSRTPNRLSHPGTHGHNYKSKEVPFILILKLRKKWGHCLNSSTCFVPVFFTRNEGRNNVGLGHFWLPNAQFTAWHTGVSNDQQWSKECIRGPAPQVLLQNGKLL